MHVGSGLTSEIEAAFDVLTALVADHPKEMAPFTVFLKVRSRIDDFKYWKGHHNTSIGGKIC